MTYFEYRLLPKRDRWPAIKDKENIVPGNTGDSIVDSAAVASSAVRSKLVLILRHNQRIDFQESSTFIRTALTEKSGIHECVSVYGGRGNESRDGSLKSGVPVHSAFGSGRLLSVVDILSPLLLHQTKSLYTYLPALLPDRLTIEGAHKNLRFYGVRFIVYCLVRFFISHKIQRKRKQKR